MLRRALLLLISISFLPNLAGLRAEGLKGKVVTGYQGWFRTPSDGTGTGWFHYGSRGKFAPGNCTIDLWPDVSELPAADRVATEFRFADGSTAEVFSSVSPSVANLHFKWMRDYGIDAAFLQRFAVMTRDERHRKAMDTVLDNCRNAAHATKREWVLMYDLSGLKPGNADVVIRDWRHLQERFALTDAAKNPGYLRHRGKPLVALWGFGFSDRDPMLDDWRRLIDFFKGEAVAGGCSLMLGVPAYWRTRDRDAIADPAWHDLLVKADVISPWNVGRYDWPRGAARHAERTLAADLAWCRERRIDYLPVVFPGFSWHNLSASRGKEARLNQIPRLNGQFLWSQFRSFHRAGVEAFYVAMFDELDEATAIFKCRSDVPVGASPFVSEPDVPADHYLWLTGQARRLLRGQIFGSGEALPVRK